MYRTITIHSGFAIQKLKRKKKHNLAENKRYSCSQDAYCLFRETTKSKYDKCLIRNCQEEKSSEVC